MSNKRLLGFNILATDEHGEPWHLQDNMVFYKGHERPHQFARLPERDAITRAVRKLKKDLDLDVAIKMVKVVEEREDISLEEAVNLESQLYVYYELQAMHANGNKRDRAALREVLKGDIKHMKNPLD